MFEESPLAIMLKPGEKLEDSTKIVSCLKPDRSSFLNEQPEKKRHVSSTIEETRSLHFIATKV